jgi:hypothetical protein
MYLLQVKWKFKGKFSAVIIVSEFIMTVFSVCLSLLIDCEDLIYNLSDNTFYHCV